MASDCLTAIKAPESVYHVLYSIFYIIVIALLYLVPR